MHFPSTELADASMWHTCMHGAIQSGEREAHKIAAELAKVDDAIKLRHIFDANHIHSWMKSDNYYAIDSATKQRTK